MLSGAFKQNNSFLSVIEMLSDLRCVLLKLYLMYRSMRKTITPVTDLLLYCMCRLSGVTGQKAWKALLIFVVVDWIVAKYNFS